MDEELKQCMNIHTQEDFDKYTKELVDDTGIPADEIYAGYDDLASGIFNYVEFVKCTINMLTSFPFKDEPPLVYDATVYFSGLISNE